MLAYKPHQRISPEEALKHPFISSGGHSYVMTRVNSTTVKNESS